MILIHTAGNSSIGIGNLSRCSTLASYLKQNSNKDIFLLMECSKELGYRFAVDGINNFIVSDKEEGKKILNSINIKDDGVLIVDLLNLNNEDRTFYKSLGFKRIVQINDSNIEEFNADIVINGDGFEREFKVSKDTKIYSGPEYIILKLDVYKNRTKAFKYNDVKNILVCFGGADPAIYTEDVVNEIMNDSRLNKFKFNIVLGPAFSDERIKNLEKQSKKNIKYIYKPKNLIKHIQKNDLVITLGGLTTYEALCLGKPVATLGWNYMDYYVKKMSENNLTYYLGNNSLGVKNLYECINNNKKLKEIAFNGFNKIDGNATKRILKIINGDENYE